MPRKRRRIPHGAQETIVIHYEEWSGSYQEALDRYFTRRERAFEAMAWDAGRPPLPRTVDQQFWFCWAPGAVDEMTFTPLYWEREGERDAVLHLRLHVTQSPAEDGCTVRRHDRITLMGFVLLAVQYAYAGEAQARSFFHAQPDPYNQTDTLGAWLVRLATWQATTVC